MEENSQQKVKKTKKAIRKMNKRENISKKKKLLPMPQKGYSLIQFFSLFIYSQKPSVLSTEGFSIFSSIRSI